MSDILNRILARKAEEIEQRSRVRPLEELRDRRVAADEHR